MGKHEIIKSQVPPPEFTRFIRKHHVLTLATSGVDGLWCSNMFYAYIPGENVFVFTSDEGTRHVNDILGNARVAASIVLETRTVGRIQGLQITGTVEKADPRDDFRKAYVKKFPYAAMADLKLWLLRPDIMKLTDNTLGFGKKIVWVATATPI